MGHRLTDRCPFCGGQVPIRRRGPWPFHAHDRNGRPLADGAGSRCPGSRAVLPLYANPWLQFVYTQEHPVHIDIYREALAQNIEPGDTIDENGPIYIDEVVHGLNGAIRLMGLRPGHKRREATLLKAGNTVRVLPTTSQEVEAWGMLAEAIERAARHWYDEQEDLIADGEASPAAPWEVDHDTLVVRTGTRRFALVRGTEPDPEPEPTTETDTPPPPAKAAG